MQNGSSAQVLEEAPARCGARTRGGGLCRKSRGWGTDHVGLGRCKLHGGASPNGRKAAHREGARALLAEYGRPVPERVDPVEFLRDLLDESAGNVAALRGLVSEEEGRGRLVTPLGVSAVVELYGNERDRAHRLTRDAIALGILEAERAADEALTVRLGDAVERALDGAGIFGELRDAFRVELGRELRAIGGA